MNRIQEFDGTSPSEALFLNNFNLKWQKLCLHGSYPVHLESLGNLSPHLLPKRLSSPCQACRDPCFSPLEQLELLRESRPKVALSNVVASRAERMSEVPHICGFVTWSSHEVQMHRNFCSWTLQVGRGPRKGTYRTPTRLRSSSSNSSQRGETI